LRLLWVLPKEFKKGPDKISSDNHFETDLIVGYGHDASNEPFGFPRAVNFDRSSEPNILK
jgi:hypothetical protein